MALTVKQAGTAFGPSERFTADMADLDNSTLNIVNGESGNHFRRALQRSVGRVLPRPHVQAAVLAEAVNQAAQHHLQLQPQ